METVEFAPGYETDPEKRHIYLLPRDVEWRRALYPSDPKGLSVFHHPAKMQLHIVKLAVEHYRALNPGWESRTIKVLDPFGGTGTTALAALMGCETTLMEIEQEWFLPLLQQLRRNWRNWEKEVLQADESPIPFTKENFHWAAEHLLILLGDSRQLLRQVEDDHYDLVITSPPYANLQVGKDYGNQEGALAEHKEELRKYGSDKASPQNFGRLNTFQFNMGMKSVYRELGRVIKPGGFYVSVTKDQMRGDQRQRLGPEVIRYTQDSSEGKLKLAENGWFKWKPPGGMMQSMMKSKGSEVVEDEDILFFKKGE